MNEELGWTVFGCVLVLCVTLGTLRGCNIDHEKEMTLIKQGYTVKATRVPSNYSTLYTWEKVK